MNSVDAASAMLIATHLLALGVGLSIFVGIFVLHRRARRLQLPISETAEAFFVRPNFNQRPTSWLAIRSADPKAVQAVLGVNRFAPCSWSEGMAGEHEFFISPQVNGWVIVTGRGLPDPGDDVDACFLFLIALSRQLGHVQFFHADRILHHHAWARMDEGCVTRAFAWAGETVWNQGIETLPEIELGLKSFAYGDLAMTIQDAESNFEKIPLLAARWSLDPAEISRHRVKHNTGIAGGAGPIY